MCVGVPPGEQEALALSAGRAESVRIAALGLCGEQKLQVPALIYKEELVGGCKSTDACFSCTYFSCIWKGITMFERHSPCIMRLPEA